MAEDGLLFRYVAFDGAGRRIRGEFTASSEPEAFQRLKGEGLSPLKLSPARPRSGGRTLAHAGIAAGDLETLCGDLAVLLRAGADIRSALSILAERAASARMTAACQTLSGSILEGESVEASLLKLLGGRSPAIPAVIAAAEASGDLASGFERASEILKNRRRISEQMVSALSYPAFILASSIGAALMILLIVVPTLEPLVEGAGSHAPPILAALLAVSAFLRDGGPFILAGIVLGLAGVALAWRSGVLKPPLERLALDGPASLLVRGLMFGAFARALGGLLAAKAPMADALRLAIRAAPWGEVRARLDPVLVQVRQGEALSAALARVRGLPPAIARLAAVGEASGTLGPMLERAGAFEEAETLKRIESASKLLGPILIVLLGLMIGGLMAGLLSGVTGLGEAALR